MRKSILAWAVVGALSIPLTSQADTILYGSARVSIDYDDQNDDFTNNNWDIVNNSSRLGVLGTEDLGGGLSAIYQYEFGVDLTEGSNWNSNRPKFVGLKGDFGTVSIGTQETPYYHVSGIVDIFNSAKTFVTTQTLGAGLSFSQDRNFSSGDLVRLDNSLYYSTPDFSGFTGEAMLVMNGSCGGESTLCVKEDTNALPDVSNDIDAWNISGKYANGPFFAGLSYFKLEGNDNVLVTVIDDYPITIDLDLDLWTVGLGYNVGPFSFGFIYEQGDMTTLNLIRKMKIAGYAPFTGDDAKNWFLTGQYVFGNNTVRAAYGQVDTGIDGEKNIDNYLVGYQYNFSKRTSVWLEYIGRNAKLYDIPGDSSTAKVLGDQNSFSIGTRVDF